MYDEANERIKILIAFTKTLLFTKTLIVASGIQYSNTVPPLSVTFPSPMSLGSLPPSSLPYSQYITN